MVVHFERWYATYRYSFPWYHSAIRVFIMLLFTERALLFILKNDMLQIDDRFLGIINAINVFFVCRCFQSVLFFILRDGTLQIDTMVCYR